MKRRRTFSSSRRSTTYKRPRRRYKRKSSYYPLARIGQELKWHDNTRSSTMTDAGGVHILTDISQGNLGYQRNSKTVTLKSISIDLSFTAADSYNYGRFIIFRWMRDSTPAVNDILQDPGTGITAWNHISINNRDVIKVYRDVRVVSTTGTGGVPYVNKRVYIDLSKKVTTAEWKFGTNTVTRGHIYCLVISDSAAATHPGYWWECRTRFLG